MPIFDLCNRMTVCVLLMSVGKLLPAVEYSVVDIGSLGGTRTVAFDLNNNGEVVGYSATASGLSLPFKYSAGVMSPLNRLVENGFSNAISINNAGQVAGYGVDEDKIYRSFRYENGLAQQTNVPSSVQSFAHTIDDSGKLFGHARDTQDRRFAFVEDQSGVSILTVENSDVYLKGVSNSGKAVLEVVSDDGFVRIMQYYEGEYSLVYEPPGPGFGHAWAQAINESGTVVGQVRNEVASRREAAILTNGEVKFLGSILGETSRALDINRFGTIVGSEHLEGDSGDIYVGFVYRDNQLFDLNELVPPSSVRDISHAVAINDHGQILAHAFVDGRTRSFLLTPINVPEPSASLALAIMSLFAWSGASSRRVRI